MAFCSRCGATVADDEKFCSSCGAKIGEDGFAGPSQSSARASAADNSKTYSILAVVFPILFFLPIVTEPKTAFGTFWANQALLLLLGYVVSGLMCFIFIGYALEVVMMVFWIMSIVAVCNGEMKPVPLIGSIEIIK